MVSCSLSAGAKDGKKGGGGGLFKRPLRYYLASREYIPTLFRYVYKMTIHTFCPHIISPSETLVKSTFVFDT